MKQIAKTFTVGSYVFELLYVNQGFFVLFLPVEASSHPENCNSA